VTLVVVLAKTIETCKPAARRKHPNTAVFTAVEEGSPSMVLVEASNFFRSTMQIVHDRERATRPHMPSAAHAGRKGFGLRSRR
jgi:hypothetical protein